jgi:hypothetical protein
MPACGFNPKIPKEARQTCHGPADCPAGFVCTPAPGKPSVLVCCRNASCDDISVDIARDAGVEAARSGDAEPDVPVREAETPDTAPDLPTDRALDAPADADPCGGLSCPKDAVRCGTGGGVQTCVAMGACTVWTAEMPCPGMQTCNNGRCNCPSPPAGCQGAGSTCESPTTVLRCITDATGCLTGTEKTTCPSGKTCKGSFPNASCQCPADNVGAPCGSCGGTVQCDGSCSKSEAPSCGGKVCGADDGCGGKCRGSCASGLCIGDPPSCRAITVKLLVGASTGQSVSAFDGITGQRLGDFTTGGPATNGPSALAFGGPQKNLFVKGSTHTIEEYDGHTGAFVRTLVTSGVEGGGMDFGPDGSLYAADSGGNIARWNVTTGALVGVFVAKSAGNLDTIGGLRFGPDGNLYVGSFSVGASRHQVLRFDGTTGASMGAFVTSGSGGLVVPRDFVFARDSLFVVSAANQVLRYDDVSGAFLDVFVAADAAGLAFGPDDNLYVSIGSSDEVRRYNGSTGAFIGVFAMDTSPRPTFLLFAPP